MRPNIYTKSLLSLIAIFAALFSHAQEAAATVAPAAASASSSDDYLVYILIAFATILLITIAVLGQVLIRLTIYAYQNKGAIAKTVILFLMLGIGGGQSLLAQTAPGQTVASVTHSTSPGFSLDFIVAICVVLTEVLVVAIMLIRIWALINTIYPKAEAAKGPTFELPKWFDRFNESVAIENETDIMLDHDYDGIKELDNQLPPWWKYGFIFTIIWAIGYLTYFHVMEAAPLSAGEYANEMEAAKLDKDAYMRTAKNNVDENTIVFDKSYLADGQKIFTDNCVACHGAKGEGGVGPNLTDQYWIHGGKINDVFKTVKYGWPANGMKSWQTDFSSMQIAQVVCYVKSLKGSNPANPKAPQGEVYNEDGGAKADSSATTSIVVKDTVSK